MLDSYNTATVRLALETDSVREIVNIINQVYQVGERGILIDTDDHPLERVTVNDVREWIACQKLFVVEISENQKDDSSSTKSKEDGSRGKIVGCVKIDRVVDETTSADTAAVGEWGCLAVSLQHQKQGLGRKLSQFAEDYSKHKLNCSAVQLELLSPTHWKHAHKEMLREWYTQRMGYRLKVSGDYEASTARLPASSRLAGRFLLATDADFTTYCKQL
jgi:GNAT superfamily N-acetyltransferase